ncbi:MAG: hypothetical protein OXT65_08705 [Alphaproteobacteria bacterium]|nr:hypothetical protein [Alphaproteobacteria bacterium]
MSRGKEVLFTSLDMMVADPRGGVAGMQPIADKAKAAYAKAGPKSLDAFNGYAAKIEGAKAPAVRRDSSPGMTTK